MNTQVENFTDLLPTSAAIEALLSSYEAQDAEARKNSEYRMQNYFNCVDDYSWGGICDQAASQAESIRMHNRNVLKNQLENGIQKEVFTVNVLTDLDGNVVSETIVNGKFGPCWLIKNESGTSFLSVAKKAATYEKKGYKVMQRQITCEYYYTLRHYKSGKLVIMSRVVSDEICEFDYKENQTTYLAREAYIALN